PCHPVDEPAKRGGGTCRHVVPRGEPAIQRERFFEHLMERPAVQQQMVVTPQEEVAFAIETRERKAAQRRGAEIESLRDVLRAQPCDGRRALLLAERAPVLLAPRKRSL